MSDENGELPDGWLRATLGDVVIPKVRQGAPEDDFTYVDIGSINNTTKEVEDTKQFAKGEKVPSRARQQLQTNDVLVSMTRPNLNAVAMVPESLNESVGSTGFDVLRAIEIESKWLFLTVRSLPFVKAMSDLVQGALYPAVKSGDVRSYELNLPPLPEIRRIDAKVEALQERSRSARESLQAIKPLLETFRRSVLAAAFRGDLTADWRAQHPDVEPASELLDRIRAERRQRWEEAELAKYEAKGKKPPKGWKDKYKEPEPVDSSQQQALPEGWCWTSLSELSHWAMYGPRFSSDAYADHGARVLRTTDFSANGSVDLSTPPQIPLDDETLEKYRVDKGDLLITRTGSLGTLAVFPGGDDSIAGAFLIHYRLAAPLSQSWYVFHFLKSPIGQQFLIEKGAGTGRPNLNMPRINSIPIPLAPAQEQQVLLNVLEAAMFQIEGVETTITDSTSQLTTLDQAILAKAFRGELVPQDPNDEPASVLLERIREQREAAKVNGKKKTKRPRKKKA